MSISTLPPDLTRLLCDVLVVGGGIGGLTAARSAMEAGARVALIEKAPGVGGSAAASGGQVWCAKDVETWLQVQPGGDPALGRALIDAYGEGVAWLPSQGVPVTPVLDQVPYRFARTVYQLEPDARGAMDALAAGLVAGGGRIVLLSSLGQLHLTPAGAIAGATVRGPEGLFLMEAASVVLATGGFQASAEMRARYLGRWADRIVVRSNPYSTGDGLSAATRVGAGTAGVFSRFYGHMLPAPPARVGLHNFASIKPTFSEYAVFLNLNGCRFDDEFLGDEVTVHAAVHQPEAVVVLVYDEGVRLRHAVPPPGSPPIRDRLRNIQMAGGEIITAVTLSELTALMAAGWGINPRALTTLDRYNEVCRGGDTGLLDAPRSGGLEALETPPFYAIRLLPGTTFSYGGIRINPILRAIRKSSRKPQGIRSSGAFKVPLIVSGITCSNGRPDHRKRNGMP